MKVQAILPIAATLIAGARATVVNWHGCDGEFQQTNVADGDCIDIEGFKKSNLCSVDVPPPGQDRCEFYDSGCGSPFFSTEYCGAGQNCPAQSWPAIGSYQCYTQ